MARRFGWQRAPQRSRRSAVRLPIAYFVAAAVAVGVLGPAPARAQVCARVKIEIVQEVTLERQAFDARLRVTNGADDVPLEGFGVEVVFQDAAGATVSASSDPNDPDALFFIALDTLDGVDAIDGSGQVGSGAEAEVHWLIVPAPGAAGPGGTLYAVGARVTYTLGGEEHTTDVAPDTITVRPMPELHLDYFLPAQVHGDNPYTDDVEPAEPFTLGVRASNLGLGAAANLAIESGQPKIVENEQGLLIAFEIIGSEVNEEPGSTSLLVDLGTLEPGAASVARWFMTASLQGRFISFDATFTHDDALGGKLTSLLEEVTTHELEHDVRVDLPGRDGVRDFLALDGAGNLTVYESDLVDGPVWDVTDADLLPVDADTWTLSVPPTAGFSRALVEDPTAGTRVVASVVRADGRVIPVDNAWLSPTWIKDSQSYDYHLGVFDTGNPLALPYTVVFGGVALANHAPVLAPLPERAVRVGEDLAYGVQATDPDGPAPTVQVGQALPPGAVFSPLGGGAGLLAWTPTEAQLGTWSILIEATDGKLFAKGVATIHVVPADTPNGAPTSVSATIQTTVDTPSAPVTPVVVDPDPEDAHFFTLLAQPAHGAAQVVDNQLVYSPAPGFTGADVFAIQAMDLFGETVDGTADVLVTGYDNLTVTGLSLDPAGGTAAVAVRLEGAETPVVPVEVRVRAVRCGAEAVVGSLLVTPAPGDSQVLVPVDLTGEWHERAFVLVADVDAGGVLPEPDELDNRVSIAASTGGASTLGLTLGSAAPWIRKTCAGVAHTTSGRATWGVVEGQEACHDIAAAGQPVSWRLVDPGTGSEVRSGVGVTDANGAWHVETGMPEESGALYTLEVGVGESPRRDAWSATVAAVPCPATTPPSMVPEPPYPGPGGGDPIVLFTGAGATLPWLVHPGTPVPTAGPDGSGAKGATWGTGASDQVTAGGPLLGAQGGVAAFDASVPVVLVAEGSAVPAGQPVRLRGVVEATDSLYGLPVSWTATGPGGAAIPVAPTTWFYVNGTLHVQATWTPPFAGTWTVTLTVGPTAGDTDPTDDSGSFTLDVEPPLPSPTGLALWLEAGAGVEVDASGLVASWGDASGTAHDATQVNPTLRPRAAVEPGGVPSVRFDGAQALELPAGLAGLDGGVTIIAVVAPDRAAASTVLSIGPGQATEALALGTDADARARWSVGKRVSAGGVEAEIGAPQLLSLVHTAGDHVRIATGAGLPWTGKLRAPQAGSHDPIRVGAAPGPDGAPFRGAVLALLIYERALADGERDGIEAWLAGRHGAWHPKAPWLDALPPDAQALAAAHRWSRAEAEAWVAWRGAHPSAAIPGDGLALWLDAAAGVTKVDGAVTAWADQSATPAPAGATAGAAARPLWVAAAIGDRPALRFDGSDDALDLAPGLADLRRNGLTIAAVVRSTAGRRSAPILSLATTTGGGRVELRRLGFGPEALLGVEGAALSGPVGFEAAEPSMVLATVGPDGHSSLAGTGDQAAEGALPRPAGIARDASRMGRDGKGLGFKGDVAELLVWDRRLDADEQDAVALWLADRYGLFHPAAAWLTGLPPDVVAAATAGHWSRDRAEAYAAFVAAHPAAPALGLALWLRADVGVTATGGAVSAWDDMSPSGADGLQPFGDRQPLLTQLPAVRFDGVDDGLTLPAGFGRFDEGLTFVAVVRAGNGRFGAPLFGARTAAGTAEVAIQAADGLRYVVGKQTLTAPTALLPGRLEVVTVVHDAAGAVVRVGGAPVAAGELALPVTALREQVGVGRLGAAAFGGDVLEVMLWTRALPADQLDVVEAALADAWGAWHPGASWAATLDADVLAKATAEAWSQGVAAAWSAWDAVWGGEGPPGDGLAVWLRSTVGVTAADGVMTSWANAAPTEVAGAAVPEAPDAAPTVTDTTTGPAITFDGVDDGLLLPPGLAALDLGYTLVVVAKPDVPTRWGRLLELAGPHPVDLVGLRRKSETETLRLTVGTASLDAAQALGSQARILSVVASGGSATIRSQGVVRGEGALAMPTRALRDRSVVGLGSDGLAPFSGSLREVAVWERALSPAELDAVEVALADALGLYHPNAAWIAAWAPADAAVIHANRWNKDQAEAALP